MTSALDDSSLSLDKDTNRFLVQVRIEFQISYSTIKDFIIYLLLKIKLWKRGVIQYFSFQCHFLPSCLHNLEGKKKKKLGPSTLFSFISIFTSIIQERKIIVVKRQKQIKKSKKKKKIYILINSSIQVVIHNPFDISQMYVQ